MGQMWLNYIGHADPWMDVVLAYRILACLKQCLGGFYGSMYNHLNTWTNGFPLEHCTVPMIHLTHLVSGFNIVVDQHMSKRIIYLSLFCSHTFYTFLYSIHLKKKKKIWVVNTVHMVALSFIVLTFNNSGACFFSFSIFHSFSQGLREDGGAVQEHLQSDPELTVSTV